MSLALPSGRILPRAGGPALPDIPLTRIGLVDTLKVKLHGPVCQHDIRRLLKTGEFTSKKSSAREVASSNVFVKQLGSQTFLYRKRDGLRIMSFENCAFVEFSSPRVLGLYSDEQHLMSELDLRRAVDASTTELLPWSTARARASRADEPWSIHRQDFAVNLDGSIDEVNEALRKSKPFLARTSRSTVFDGAGIGWYGTDYDVVVYDPSVRPPRGKLRSSLEHQSFRPNAGRRLRIEIRLKTPRAVGRYAALLEVDGGGLPYSLSREARDLGNVRLRVDNNLAHRFLARAVAGLNGSNVAPLDHRAYKSFGKYAQRKLLALHPDEWAVAEAMLSPEVLRELRKDVTAISLELRDLDLLRQAWCKRRFSPITLWHEQRRREDRARHDGGQTANIPVNQRTLEVLRMLNGSKVAEPRSRRSPLIVGAVKAPATKSTPPSRRRLVPKSLSAAPTARPLAERPAVQKLRPIPDWPARQQRMREQMRQRAGVWPLRSRADVRREKALAVSRRIQTSIERDE
ncbi:MAG: hypothetical protein L6Q99_01020 [Planctomycetes bacterium]|nr:hypothetical protein [Planctomycetota bacterium]